MRIHTCTELELTENPAEYLPVSDSYYDYEGPLALADRAAQGQAGQAFNSSVGAASQYNTAAGNAAGTLIPTLREDINNPQGYTTTQQNNQLVAGEQGAGGATSGVTGAAGLQAARTRNTGNLSAVLDQAQRQKAQTLSTNALTVANKSADLAQKKRAAALGQLGGLYNTDVSANLKALGLEPEDVNAETNAGSQGWLQDTTGILGAVGKASKGPAAYV